MLMEIASNKHYAIDAPSASDKLMNAYLETRNYQEIVLMYEKLIKAQPHVAQYHASLAATYRQMGEYDKARQEVKLFLELAPDQKAAADAFLKTLP